MKPPAPPAALAFARFKRLFEDAHAQAAIRPLIGFTPNVSGNTVRPSTSADEPELVGEQALQHGAQIGRRLEVAVLIEVGGLAGPASRR